MHATWVPLRHSQESCGTRDTGVNKKGMLPAGLGNEVSNEVFCF